MNNKEKIPKVSVLMPCYNHEKICCTIYRMHFKSNISEYRTNCLG